MIKLFRKTRQAMIKEKKTRNYLLYAVGEVLLVVVGILIAVQLNNLNESRKERGVQIDILEGIKSDILKDTIDLNLNIQGYQDIIKSDSILIDHLVKKKAIDDDLVYRIYSAANADFILILHNSYFQEAKLKGLSIISNKTLRESISRLYEFDYKVVLEVEGLESFDHFKLLNSVLGEYLSFSDNKIILSETSYKKLLSNKNILYKIQYGQNMKRGILQTHLNASKAALKIVDSIEKELVNLKE